MSLCRRLTAYFEGANVKLIDASPVGVSLFWLELQIPEIVLLEEVYRTAVQRGLTLLGQEGTDQTVGPHLSFVMGGSAPRLGFLALLLLCIYW